LITNIFYYEKLFGDGSGAILVQYAINHELLTHSALSPIEGSVTPMLKVVAI